MSPDLQSVPPYRKHLPEIALRDATEVIKRDEEYGASWQQRGGVGAFFVAWRKVDRIEALVTKHGYNVFEAARNLNGPDGLIDDIRDLRRYLMLWEAELLERGTVQHPPVEITRVNAVQIAMGEARETIEKAWLST